MTHVLACRLDNDGDVLLQGPAIRALAAGADRVTLLCGPRGQAAADGDLRRAGSGLWRVRSGVTGLRGGAATPRPELRLGSA